MMMRFVFTFVPYLLASCQAAPVCDADSKCSASVDDETSLMQSKIQLHQESQAPKVARIIGATSGMTKAQTDKVGKMLGTGKFTVVDWDGDGLSATSFTGALLATKGGLDGGGLQRQNQGEDRNTDSFLTRKDCLARPHYLPGTDAGWMVPKKPEQTALWTPGSDDKVAGAVLTDVQAQAGEDHLNKVFGDKAWQTAMGTDWVYAKLAAADVLAFPPETTFWLLSETRDKALLKNWVSLIEYRAFAKGSAGCTGCSGKYVIIDTDGETYSNTDPVGATKFLQSNAWLTSTLQKPFAEFGWNFGARIIGATKGMTALQTSKVAQLLQGYHRVDWDGDGITSAFKAPGTGAFTAALSMEAPHAFAKKACHVIVPHYLPGNPDNYYTPCVKCAVKDCPKVCGEYPSLVNGKKVFLPDKDKNPEKDQTVLSGREITQAERDAGSAHLSDVFKGDGWKTELGGSAQYAELAAADVLAFPPKTTFWLLQDDRKPAEYKNWVSLIEFKAFAKGQCTGCEGKYVIIDTKGAVLTPTELVAKLGADAELAKLGWGAAAGAGGAE